jgi:acyl dehydratase
MTIDVATLLDWPFEEIRQAYTDRDAILYALSIGVGADPMDERELRYVHEDGLRVFPTLPAVLCHPGPWMADPRSGIDRGMVVHGEQVIEVHAPLLAAATLRGRTRVLGVVDKGPGRGALVYQERRLLDDATGKPVATLLQTSFARANGGFGGPTTPLRNLAPLPETPPDTVLQMPTLPNQALLYRLNADRNALHALPEAARRAGYPRPILHGMCTFAIAAHAVLRDAWRAGGDPALRLIEGRFSAPVYPGEVIAVQMWRGPDGVRFRARVEARDATVLDRGRALLT